MPMKTAPVIVFQTVLREIGHLMQKGKVSKFLKLAENVRMLEIKSLNTFVLPN